MTTANDIALLTIREALERIRSLAQQAEDAASKDSLAALRAKHGEYAHAALSGTLQALAWTMGNEAKHALPAVNRMAARFAEESEAA